MSIETDVSKNIDDQKWPVTVQQNAEMSVGFKSPFLTLKQPLNLKRSSFYRDNQSNSPYTGQDGCGSSQYWCQWCHSACQCAPGVTQQSASVHVEVRKLIIVDFLPSRYVKIVYSEQMSLH